MTRDVRVRFAPSPTGYLHIGGVRTALFNWLFARRHGGAFVLRIDDTDQRRNREEALAPILDGFRWLGLDWDEGPEIGGDRGPYFQSEREDLYARAVERLLERGYAYLDYATPEETQEERKQAEKRGERFVYSRRWMATGEEDRRRFEAEGRVAAVRLKPPRDGECRFHDEIRGDMAFAWADEQDHIVRRADGTYLYHLASVVDDVEMGITHVIRAEEHLSNTPRQLWIFEGLGAEPPVFAHLPYVAEPGSRRKLSKRKLAKYLAHTDFAELYAHGRRIADRLGLEVDEETFNPVLVDFYRRSGFLPDALVNYLLLLGWSLDDRTESFTRDEMIRHFSLERVSRAAASFDPKKLMAFEERAMQALPLDDKLERVLPFLERVGWIEDPADEATRRYVGRLVEAAGDRIKIAGDVLDYEELFGADDAYPWDEAAFDKRILRPDGAVELLAAFRRDLAATDASSAADFEAQMRRFVEARGVKLGAIIHAARVAATGKPVGFGMFEILELLGRERVLARLDRALTHARARTTPSTSTPTEKPR